MNLKILKRIRKSRSFFDNEQNANLLFIKTKATNIMLLLVLGKTNPPHILEIKKRKKVHWKHCNETRWKLSARAVRGCFDVYCSYSKIKKKNEKIITLFVRKIYVQLSIKHFCHGNDPNSCF